MWLVEYMKDGEPHTRQGFIHMKAGTEAQGNLRAMINAFFILKKPCQALVFTRCEHILNTIQNHWHIQWKKNEWRNAKGKPVKNVELWEMLMDKTDPHIYSVHGGHHEYTNVMVLEIEKEMQAWKERSVSRNSLQSQYPVLHHGQSESQGWSCLHAMAGLAVLSYPP